MSAVTFAWSLVWIVGPFAAAPFAIIHFAKWTNRRTDAEGYAEQWISFPEDVAAIEATLPTMRRTR